MLIYFLLMALGFVVALFCLVLLCRKKELDDDTERLYMLVGGSGFMLSIVAFFVFFASSYSPFMLW